MQLPLYTNNTKSYSILEVLNNTMLGFVYEFYSSKKPEFIVNDLGKLIGKNITLTSFDTYTPSQTNAILIKEYNAPKPKYRLNIAFERYSSIISTINNISKWINETAETSHDTLMRVNLMFDHANLNTIHTVSKMQPSKLLLKFDESFVYDRFPLQKESAFVLSTKKIIPVNTYINENSIITSISEVTSSPFADFYGINFSDYTRGILQFNYIGGKDYAKYPKNITDVLEYYITKAYQSLNSSELNKDEIENIEKISEEHRKLQYSFYNIDYALNEYKDIKLSVNMSKEPQIIRSYWQMIRKPLFEAIFNSNLRKGEFNFDTDTERGQIRNAKLSNVLLKNFDIVKCELNGVLENCSIWASKIDKSRICESKLISGNKVSNSYLKKVDAETDNNINKSFIMNESEIINCRLSGTIVKFGELGKRAQLDESCVIIKKDVEPIKYTSGIEVSEVRDHNWLASLSGKSPKGFANEYRNKYDK
jgi:hypothetical protein